MVISTSIMNNTDLDLEDPDFECPYSSGKSPESAIVRLV
jgi:hypothetical protein